MPRGAPCKGIGVQGNPRTCSGAAAAAGGALCPPTPLDAAPVALGDTEAGRGGTPVPIPRGHPVSRRRKGSGWDPLPAGCRRKRGRKGLAGAPQRRDVACGTRGCSRRGDTGSPRELTHVQDDSSWSPQGHPARSPAGRPKGAVWGLWGSCSLVGSRRDPAPPGTPSWCPRGSVPPQSQPHIAANRLCIGEH